MRFVLSPTVCALGLALVAGEAFAQGAPAAPPPAAPPPSPPPPDAAPTPLQPQPGQPQPGQPQPGQPQPGQPQPGPQDPGPPYPVPTPQPGPTYPPQGYPQQSNPPQGYPQQGYPQQGYPQGGAVDPGYGPQVPASPGYGPPAPPAPPKDTCCRFAIRFDPFNLLFRRLSFQGEVAIIGPLSIEIEPSWIFGSPADHVDAKGVSIAGNVAFYLTGKAPQGFFIKAHAAYETFKATVSNPAYPHSLGSGHVGTPIFGGMIGSSTVFGRNWGFNISGGIGIGAATAGAQTIVAPGKGGAAAYAVTFYDKGSAIQLLGSLGLGIGF